MDEGGEVEMSSGELYCSLSECIVTPDSAMGLGASSDAIVSCFIVAEGNKFVENGVLSLSSQKLADGWMLCSWIDCCELAVDVARLTS